MIWAKFDELFEGQYFPKSYCEHSREQFEKLEKGTITVSEYALKFLSLSHFALELVASEERKCRGFEKGLHMSIKRLVVSQRIGRFLKLWSVQGVLRFQRMRLEM